jgi:hypothetical protein
VLMHGCSSYDIDQGYADGAHASTAAFARGLTNEGLVVTALPDRDLESVDAAAEVFRDASSQGCS